MELSELIKIIENYDCTGKSQPDKLKIICGEIGYKGTDTERFCENTDIEIYKAVGQVAFIMEDLSCKGSEFMVLAMMLDSFDKAAQLLKDLKSIVDGYPKFVNFLYYEKGIVLVNRKGKYEFLKPFMSEGVREVLFFGRYTHVNLSKALGENVHQSEIIHPSVKNWGSDEKDYADTWIYRDDSVLSNGMSFEDFKVL